MSHPSLVVAPLNVTRSVRLVKMTSTSKTEERQSPEPQLTSAGPATSSLTAWRWLCAGFMVAVVLTLAVEWLHINELRRRVSDLELTCSGKRSPTYTDSQLMTMTMNDRQHNDQRSAAEVGRINIALRVTTQQ